MLGHRLRRWPSIESTLGEWFIFAAISPVAVFMYSTFTVRMYVNNVREGAVMCIVMSVN